MGGSKLDANVWCMCRAKRRTLKSRLKLSGMAYTPCYSQLILIKMPHLLVKFKVCEQVSPDDFTLISKERLFSEDAKLSDVRDWIIANKGFIGKSNGYKQMSEVFLSEPSTF